SGGLAIYTTLDPIAQRRLDDAVADASLPDGAEVAAVFLEPDTRHVRALVGGRDHARAPFNRALFASRQAASTFKPFVYAAAFETGRVTPDTTYPNAGVSRGWGPGNAAAPADGRAVTVRDAVADSLNTVAVRA